MLWSYDSRHFRWQKMFSIRDSLSASFSMRDSLSASFQHEGFPFCDSTFCISLQRLDQCNADSSDTVVAGAEKKHFFS